MVYVRCTPEVTYRYVNEPATPQVYHSKNMYTRDTPYGLLKFIPIGYTTDTPGGV